MTDDAERDRVDTALSETLGMHGAWVLAIELIHTDTGQPVLTTLTSRDGSVWSHLGMAHILVDHVQDTIEDFADPQDTNP